MLCSLRRTVSNTSDLHQGIGGKGEVGRSSRSDVRGRFKFYSAKTFADGRETRWTDAMTDFCAAILLIHHKIRFVGIRRKKKLFLNVTLIVFKIEFMFVKHFGVHRVLGLRV